MQYLFPYDEAKTIQKFGVDITLFGEDVSTSNLVYEEVKTGHLEEFYDDVSTYMWFIIEGNGTFVINDKRVEVGPKDLIVVPPKKRIHYFGKMKMMLCVTPAFNEKNEHHVRDIDLAESPYSKD
jgi:mannose-6-phosphate isomerase-like protein (cupin superfamily)